MNTDEHRFSCVATTFFSSYVSVFIRAHLWLNRLLPDKRQTLAVVIPKQPDYYSLAINFPSPRSGSSVRR
jgi:hypothetical protein